MAINLEKHVVYVPSLKQDMIPYAVVKEYLAESFADTDESLKTLLDEVNSKGDEIQDALDNLEKGLQ